MNHNKFCNINETRYLESIATIWMNVSLEFGNILDYNICQIFKTSSAGGAFGAAGGGFWRISAAISLRVFDVTGMVKPAWKTT